MRRTLLVLCMVAACSLMAGCSGSVAGEISSKTANTPIPGATVTVGDQKVVTDTSGRFTLDSVDTGDVSYGVQAEGFGSSTGKLAVERGENTLNVTLEDGSLTIRLKENAEVREPIKKAKVTVAGQEGKKTQGATYALSSVPVGEQVVKITCPEHATAKQTVDIVPGENKVTVALDLTPEETYMRYYTGYRFKHWAQAYRMLHPDVRRHYSLEAFTKDMKGGEVLSIKFFGTKMLSKWRPSYLHKTYRHVAAIDRAYRCQSAWGTETDNRTQHWVPAKGRWYIVFDWHD